MFGFTNNEIVSIIGFANVLVLVYAILYAARFLYLLESNDARKPWELMLYSIILLFFLQVFTFVNFSINELLKSGLYMTLSGLILFVFILQNYYMKKSNYEVLTRKNFIPVKTKEINIDKKV